jgi:hypothetical protein
MDVWMNHLQEELMDAVLYLQKAREVMKEDMEDYIWNLKIKDEEEV